MMVIPDGGGRGRGKGEREKGGGRGRLERKHAIREKCLYVMNFKNNDFD